MDKPLRIRSETGRTKLDHGYTAPYPLRDRTNQTWSWINPSLSAQRHDKPNLIMDTPLLIRSDSGRTKLNHGYTPPYPLIDRTNQPWSWINPSVSAQGQDEPNLIMDVPFLIRSRTGRTNLDHDQPWSWSTLIMINLDQGCITPPYRLRDMTNQTWSWIHHSLSAQRQDEPNLIMDKPLRIGSETWRTKLDHGYTPPYPLRDMTNQAWSWIHPSLSAQGQDEPNLIMDTPLLIRSGTKRTKLDHGCTRPYPLRDITIQTWSWIHPSLSAQGQNEQNLIMDTPLLISSGTKRTKLDHGYTPPYQLRDKTNKTWSWINPSLSAQGQNEQNLIMDTPLLISSGTKRTKLDHGYTPPYQLRDKTNKTWSWIHPSLSAQGQNEPNLIMDAPVLIRSET